MPIVSRLGYLALVACWSGAVPSSQTRPVKPVPRELEGAYWCRIDNHPQHACVIRTVEGQLVLVKLGGIERFRGRIARNGDGFFFLGETFCPWGTCTRTIHGTFRPTKQGFTGTFRDDAMVVHLTPAPTSAFGGKEYGGDGYGDPFNLHHMGYDKDGWEYKGIDELGEGYR